ncbi:4'-phosphopantetheinyl transferase [Histoplasma capsulatum]|uniref:4'-phosphopantetheinyl transferase n=1 Tax=Ajellomyces capsulatus TaxID=5037 RepID=A0A8A1MFA0_AJECA|nr:4'-phosphopantetheinyl transferase [Histoplasma capsulatum]
MKLTPFPFPLSIGTDIVHLPRICRLIRRPAASNGNSGAKATTTTSTYLDRFIRRILCEEELKDYYAKFSALQHHSASGAKTLTTVPPRGPAMNAANITEMARWLAGRFAAKEAARKAAPGGASTIGWKDVMVRIDKERNGSGSVKPEIVYLKDGGVRGEVGKLSISHDGDYVVATVLAATTPTTTQLPDG